MSEIIGFAGMSHSPFATMLPPDGPDEPGSAFLADAARVAAAVTELAPDAVAEIEFRYATLKPYLTAGV